MARGSYFTVRGSRRFRQSRRGSTKKVFYIALVAVLLLVGSRFALRQEAIPAAAVSDPVIAERAPSLMERIYMEIVRLVIPGLGGLGDLPVTGGDAGDSALHKLALPDLRDPKLIVFAQLPFLLDPGIAPQPLVHEDPGNTPQLPKITIPVRHELTGEGKVIIYHTHATESFVPSSGKTFTEDLTQTVAQLGKELSALLQSKYQIPVVHNNTIHDIPRNTAYEKARPTLESLLKEYTDAELVIDLHRDGVDKDIATGTLAGQSAARILFVVGTRYEGYEENLQKARFLHDVLEEIAPGISRGIRERPFIYNQNYHPGSLLIELGTHENSLEEARITLPALAEALNRLYHSGNR